jgi:hypothetical protein
MPSTGFPGAAAGIECQIDLPSPPWTRCLTSTQPAEAEALPGRGSPESGLSVALSCGTWVTPTFRSPGSYDVRRGPADAVHFVTTRSSSRGAVPGVRTAEYCARSVVPAHSRSPFARGPGAALTSTASNTRRGRYSCLNIQASGTEGRQEPNARKRRCSRPGSRHDQALERTPLVHRRNWCLAPNCIPLEAAP